MNLRAQSPFLLAATLHAAALLPLAMLTRFTPACIPGLIDLTAQAEEMLFGFAPALIAGFLLPAREHRRIGGMLLLWVLARLLRLPDGPGFLPDILSLAFIALLGWRLVRVTWPPAQRFSHYLPAASVLMLAVAACINYAGAGWHAHEVRNLGLLMATTAIAALMPFSGGGVAPPVVARAAEMAARQRLPAMQPGMATIIATLILTAGGLLVTPLPPSAPGLLLIGAGGLVCIRLLRRRPWQPVGRPDVVALFIGHGWLGAGLILLGTHLSGIGPVSAVGVHALTIGALGILGSHAIIRRSAAITAWRRMQWPLFAAIMLSAALLLRLTLAYSPVAMLIAALLWALALLIAAAAAFISMSHQPPSPSLD